MIMITSSIDLIQLKEKYPDRVHLIVGTTTSDTLIAPPSLSLTFFRIPIIYYITYIET